MVIAIADVPLSPFVSYTYRRPAARPLEPLRACNGDSDGGGGAARPLTHSHALPLLPSLRPEMTVLESSPPSCAFRPVSCYYSHGHDCPTAWQCEWIERVSSGIGRGEGVEREKKGGNRRQPLSSQGMGGHCYVELQADLALES